MSLSPERRSCHWLRVAQILLVLVGLFGLSGCWVSSINPLYDEGTWDHPHNDPDVVLDQSLIGSWAAIDGKCTTLLDIATDGKGYDLRSVDHGDGCGDDKSHRKARLVRLDAYYFLDVSPNDEPVCDMCTAKHSILLARFDQAMLSLTPIDSDWLKKAIAEKTVNLATVAGDTDTITASSQDIKTFCRKFGGDKAAFKDDSTETYKRNPATAGSKANS